MNQTPSPAASSDLDEALGRFHRTGPEFEAWLSNHGPMATEAMARQGRPDAISAWTEGYIRQLDELPRGRFRIEVEDWRSPLGDASRLGDWTEFFLREVRERPWQEVLELWWPRLVPGLAASATHGLIRVGHAVVALESAQTQVRIDELAHGLGYWAARWLPVPLATPRGSGSALDALLAVPPIVPQDNGYRARIARLEQTDGYPEAVGGLAPLPAGEAARARLHEMIDAALTYYAQRAHGNPTMLVHACTAPNAVDMVLPHLPVEQWQPSVTAAWNAATAVVALYGPPGSAPLPSGVPEDPREVTERAIVNGDEHAVKLMDTAVRAHARSGDPVALAAGIRAVELLDPV